MSLIPENLICVLCDGYLDYAAQKLPKHACTCPPLPVESYKPTAEEIARQATMERRFQERGGCWL